MKAGVVAIHHIFCSDSNMAAIACVESTTRVDKSLHRQDDVNKHSACRNDAFRLTESGGSRIDRADNFAQLSTIDTVSTIHSHAHGNCEISHTYRG